MNLNELLKKCSEELIEKEIDDALLKSKIVLKYEMHFSENDFILHKFDEISKDKIDVVHKDIKKIIEGKPVQYITNNQNFFGLDFYVDENVLIPQPDTEVIVEEVINIVKSDSLKYKKILDICTGSGAIAISLKKNLPDCEILASDISSKALEIAKTNAQNNDAEIKFIESDCFKNISGKFDIIVSNPPYIESDVIKKLSKEVQNEPKLALDGGQDGLYFYKAFAQNVKEYLNEGGILAVEIGYNQRESVTKIFEKIGLKNVYSEKDYCGNDRIVVGKFNEEV